MSEMISLGRRHLVNAYEVKAGIGVIAGNTVWSCLSALSVRYYKKCAILIHTYLPVMCQMTLHHCHLHDSMWSNLS